MDLKTFDWEAGPDYPYKPREIIYSWDVIMDETQYDRKLRMLRQLSNTCYACTMCELGRREVEKDGMSRDPHVLSSMTPTRFVVVGQGPGLNEIIEGVPFVGASGKNFDRELAKHGLSRNDFYISNAIRCWIEGNGKPNRDHLFKCRPFLEIEINLIHPHFVITLGSVAFDVFCPNKVYSESLGNMHHSVPFGVKVFAVYHPSPLNLADANRRLDFAHQIKLVCGMVKKIKQSESAGISSKTDI